MSALLQYGVSLRAQARPDAVALVLGDERVTYARLEESSNRLAHLLAEAGCGRGDRVALLMPKIPMAVVAMLGVLKADAIYVPLDPAGPATRLARMLEVADCRAVLAAGPVERMLRESLRAANLAAQPLIGWLDEIGPTPAEAAPDFSLRDLAAFPASARPSANREDDIAHILFTSGSTGLPKGVTITHRNVLHFIRWAGRYFGIAAADRNSQHPPLHFDLSTFDIYGTLWAGAELHLVPPELNLLPHKLARYIRDARLTQWFSVPSVLNLMAKFGVVSEGDFPDLRRLMWAGEAIPTPTLIYLMRRLPHVRFSNLYGPTETTISSSCYTVPHSPADAREAVPIGTPCDGEELLVLDPSLRPVAAGEIGEIYIRGAGLSPGYWRDPVRTDAVFLPHPDAEDPADRIYRTGDLGRKDADGLYYYLGRVDTQVKSRGYRIELGEIETAVNTLQDLREGAVVALQSDGFEGALICCAYVAQRGREIPPGSLRKRLATLLPGYMLPQRWLRYDALPKNANGKIDRPALRSSFARAERGAAEKSGT